MLNFGHDTNVELLLTLLPQTHFSTQNDVQLADNFIEFNIGKSKCKCFLQAQVFTLVDETLIQKNTLLKYGILHNFDFTLNIAPKFRLAKGKNTIFELS